MNIVTEMANKRFSMTADEIFICRRIMKITKYGKYNEKLSSELTPEEAIIANEQMVDNGWLQFENDTFTMTSKGRQQFLLQFGEIIR